MFLEYEYNNSIINSTSSQSGGKYGKDAFKKLTIYLLLLLAFIFEIIEPLTEGNAQQKFKNNRDLFVSFTIFSVIIPILIFYFIWAADGQAPKKRKGTIIIIVVFLLLQFATTFAALIYSNAYGDRSVKSKVLFYFRLLFLYSGMILSVITVALK